MHNDTVHVRIPEDLYPDIFDHLEGDKDTLSKCSTVSKEFLNPCRRVLFRRIVVGEVEDGTKFTGFQRFLQDHPAHCRLIKHLGLAQSPMYGSYLPGITPSQVWDIVRLLPSLQQLVFQNVSFGEVEPLITGVPCIHMPRLEFRSCVTSTTVFRRFLRPFIIGELCIGALLTHGEWTMNLEPSDVPTVVRSLVLLMTPSRAFVEAILSAIAWDSCENLYAYASSTSQIQTLGCFVERTITGLRDITLNIQGWKSSKEGERC